MADGIQIVADRIEFNGEIVALIMPNIRATLRQDFEAVCKSSDRIEELEKENNDLDEENTELKDVLKEIRESIDKLP